MLANASVCAPNGLRLSGFAQEETMIRVLWYLAALFAATQLAPTAIADQCSNPNYSCDDTGSPECWYNPARQEYACSPRGWNHCASMHRSYSCAPGTNCFGDGSKPPYCTQRRSLKIDRNESRAVAATKQTPRRVGLEATAIISNFREIAFQTH